MGSEVDITWLTDFHAAMREAKSIERGINGCRADLEYALGETPLVIHLDHLSLELAKQLEIIETSIHSMIHDEYTRSQAEVAGTLTTLLDACSKTESSKH